MSADLAPGIVVRCECCDGTGGRRLTRIEATTLAAVTGEWRGTADVRGALRRVKNTTLCMRLARLEVLGLIESRREPNEDRRPSRGRAKQWRLRGLRVRARSVLG